MFYGIYVMNDFICFLEDDSIMELFFSFFYWYYFVFYFEFCGMIG